MHLWFTIVPPPETFEPTTNVANFVGSQSVVVSNPTTVGNEWVETAENCTARDFVEDVAGEMSEYEEITENDDDFLEPPPSMDTMLEDSLIEEVSSDCMIPAPLTHLYDVKYKTYSQNKLLENTDELFNQINITDEEAAAVEERTCQQRLSPDWHEQRHGRITASFFMMCGLGKLLLTRIGLCNKRCTIPMI